MSFRSYKLPPYEIVPIVTISTVIISLNVTGKLQFYIHPRYIIFTTVFAVVSLLASLIYTSAKNHHHPVSRSAAQFILYTVCAVALFIPATSISSDLAITRSGPSAAGKTETSLYDSFSTDFSHFTIKDWSSVFANGSVAQDLSGKSTTISGFLLLEGDSYYLSRFQLTCCAVDATPIKVEIKDSEKRLETMENGTWLEVSGLSVINDSEQYIEVKEVEKINEPTNPYIY